MPEEERLKLLPVYLNKANSHISVREFARDVGILSSKLKYNFPEIIEIIEKKAREKFFRWSNYYACCRDCGTTEIPHFKKGQCDKCWGIYRWERRENFLKENPRCSVCGMDRQKAKRKYKSDLYIAKNGRVFCKICFKQMTGRSIGKNRWAKVR